MVSPNIMLAPRWAIVVHWATCFLVFFSFFWLFVCCLFLNFVHKWIISNKYKEWITTTSTVYDFNACTSSRVINTMHAGSFYTFTSFPKLTFFKHSYRNTIRRWRTLCIQFRVNVLAVLTRVQTVCKDYQQKTKVAAGKERVNKTEGILNIKMKRCKDNHKMA